jgi:hypothetical protein
MPNLSAPPIRCAANDAAEALHARLWRKSAARAQCEPPKTDIADLTGPIAASRAYLRSLHQSYPVSAVLRTSPPPQSARPVPHGRPVGPVIPDLTTLWGFPCCVRFPCVRAAATTPVQRLGVVVAHLTQPYQPSPITLSGRPAHRPFRDPMRRWSRPAIREHEVAAVANGDRM